MNFTGSFSTLTQWIVSPLVVVGVALLFSVGARIGLTLPHSGTIVALIWPPTGIAFAVVWVLGLPGVLGTMLGAFLVNFSTTESLGFSLMVAVGNVLSALAACRILRYFEVRELFLAPSEFSKFLVAAVLFGPLLSALIGTIALWINGMQASSDLLPTGLVWWSGDALGVLLVAPPLLALREQPILGSANTGFPGLSLLGLVGLGFLGLLLLHWSDVSAESAAFAGLALIIWTALRFPLFVVSIIILIMTALAVWATARGSAPFGPVSFHVAFSHLHLFLAGIGGVGLALSVAVQALLRSLKIVDRNAESLASTLRSIGDGLVATDVRGRVSLMNAAAEELTGWRQAEALHQPLGKVVELLDPATGRPVQLEIDPVVGTDRPLAPAAPPVLASRDGARRAIAYSAASVRRGQGGFLGTAIVFRDLSREQRLRCRLRESEARTRAIVEAAGDILVLLSPEGTVMEANPAAQAMLAIPAESEAYPLSATPWWTQDSARQMQFLKAIDTALRGAPGSFESSHHDPSGNAHVIDFHLSPIFDEDGKVYYCLLHGRDISPWKKAEARIAGQARILALAASQARLDEILTEVARFMERLEPALRCAIMTADNEAGVLRYGAAPSMAESYNRATDNLPIREGMGSCGTAAARGAPVIVTDVATDPLWANYRVIAVENDIRACWSFPVWSVDAELLGTFALYCSERLSPTSEQANLLGYAASLTAMVLERQRDHQRLRDSEEQYRATFEQAAVGMAHLGLNGRWLRVNGKLSEILGFTAEKLLNRSIEEVSHPEDLCADQESSRRILSGANPTASVEKCFRRKNGEACWTQFTLSLMRQSTGEPRYFIAVVEDISEKKQHLDQIRRSRDRLARQQAGLLSLTDDPSFFLAEPKQALALLTTVAAETMEVRRANVWRLTEDGNTLCCLAGFDGERSPTTVGYELSSARYPVYFATLSSLDSIVAEDVRQHPACGELLKSHFEPAGITATLDVPVCLFGRFCGVLCFEHVGSPRRWREEDRYFALSLANLVSLVFEHAERRRAEAALRASELSLRETLQNAPNVAIQWYDCDGRILYWNPASENLYGWTSKETLGRSLDQFLLNPKPAIVFRDAIATVLSTRRAVGPVEFLTRHRNGSPRIVVSTLFAIPGASENAPHVVCMDVDTTGQKRSEAALRHRDRILEMVVFATERLLGTTDWVQEIQPLFAHLGMAVGVDRVSLFENHNEPDEIWSYRKLEWTLTGASPRDSTAVFRSLPLREAGFDRWIRSLGRGEIIAGNLHDFPAPERPLLAAGNLRSLAVAPVFSRQRWWGFIVFSDSCGNRDWSQVDLDAVKAVANNLGTAIGRQQAEASLLLAATAFETSEGILITDARGTILRVNQALSVLTGYVPEELVGQSPALLKSPRHEPAFYREAWTQLRARGHWEGEIWTRTKAGEEAPRWASVKPVMAEAGTVSHYVATFLDISERKRAEQEIIQLAYYDPLTGLPNRRLLSDRLQHAIVKTRRDGTRGALMFVDIDHFKHLNDVLGHLVGDLLLKQVAERMRALTRQKDSIGRLGGDEFVVLLEDLSKHPEQAVNQARRVAEKIVEDLDRPFLLGENEHHISGSVGVVIFPEDGITAEDILKRADLAMYRAKEGGRNTLWFFEPSMQAAAERRLAIEKALRGALANREFEIYLQAQTGIRGEIQSAETLLRWVRPGVGVTVPADFITIAEESGLIVPIGEWVLESACRLIQAQTAAGRPLGISVNLSLREFRRPDIARWVQGVLERTAADPTLLTLEVTEDAMINDIAETRTKMALLRDIGVHFAIDGFGVGRSSLAYLRQLPISEIKIDRSFIANVTTNADDAAIVDAILALADRLGIEVMAEGVEAPEQAEFLAARGCRRIQGYLYGRPTPAAEFLRFLGTPGID